MRRNLSTYARQGAVFCFLLATVLAVQVWVGAYRAEPTSYSDEASHFMNALLVRDYLTHGLGEAPLHFAERYYLNYPKISFGMWGWVEPALVGLFLLPGWSPHAAALVFGALVAAWSAWRLQRMTPWAPSWIRWAFGLLFLLTPIVVHISATTIMLDMTIAALSLEATYWLSIFFASGRVRDAALFGLCAVLCCSTKGNGVLTVLLPPVLLLLTGRFDLLRRPGLYVAAAMVIVFAVPVLVFNYRMDAAIGDFGPVTLARILKRLAFYSAFVWRGLGPPTVVLAVVGAVEALRLDRDGGPPTARALVALIVSIALFHVLNVHTEDDGRYMAAIVAPMLALASLGLIKAAALLPVSRPRLVTTLAALAGAGFICLAQPTLDAHRPLGFFHVASVLAASDGLAGRRLLVVTDEAGEGALVAAVAVRDPRPRATVIRGSKLLAEDDWAGHHLRTTYATGALLMHDLEALHLDYLIVDTSDGARRLPYWPQVSELMNRYQDRLETVLTTTAQQRGAGVRPIVVYRLKYRSSEPAKKLRINLKYSLGKALEEAP